ncbi:hypothetical protein WN943_027431 [Citrus x changshan-huyou]
MGYIPHNSPSTKSLKIVVLNFRQPSVPAKAEDSSNRAAPDEGKEKKT